MSKKYFESDANVEETFAEKMKRYAAEYELLQTDRKEEFVIFDPKKDKELVQEVFEVYRKTIEVSCEKYDYGDFLKLLIDNRHVYFNNQLDVSSKRTKRLVQQRLDGEFDRVVCSASQHFLEECKRLIEKNSSLPESKIRPELLGKKMFLVENPNPDFDNDKNIVCDVGLVESEMGLNPSYEYFENDVMLVLNAYIVEKGWEYNPDVSYLVNGPIEAENKAHTHHVLLTPPVGTHEPIGRFLDKTSMPRDLISECLGLILDDDAFFQTLSLKFSDGIAQKLLKNFLSTLTDNDDVLSTVWNCLVEARFNWGQIHKEIERRMALSKTPTAIDEAMQLIACRDDAFVRILFPMNIPLPAHWVTAEINITKQNESLDVECLIYDPFGGGDMDQGVFSDIDEIFHRKIEEYRFAGELKLTVAKKKNDFLVRQVDSKSCGPIVCEDIILRMEGKSLNRNVYESGALECRSEQLACVTRCFAETNPAEVGRFSYAVRASQSSLDTFSNNPAVQPSLFALENAGAFNDMILESLNISYIDLLKILRRSCHKDKRGEVSLDDLSSEIFDVLVLNYASTLDRVFDMRYLDKCQGNDKKNLAKYFETLVRYSVLADQVSELSSSILAKLPNSRLSSRFGRVLEKFEQDYADRISTLSEGEEGAAYDFVFIEHEMFSDFGDFGISSERLREFQDLVEARIKVECLLRNLCKSHSVARYYVDRLNYESQDPRGLRLGIRGLWTLRHVLILNFYTYELENGRLLANQAYTRKSNSGRNEVIVLVDSSMQFQMLTRVYEVKNFKEVNAEIIRHFKHVLTLGMEQIDSHVRIRDCIELLGLSYEQELHSLKERFSKAFQERWLPSLKLSINHSRDFAFLLDSASDAEVIHDRLSLCLKEVQAAESYSLYLDQKRNMPYEKLSQEQHRRYSKHFDQLLKRITSPDDAGLFSGVPKFVIQHVVDQNIAFLDGSDFEERIYDFVLGKLMQWKGVLHPAYFDAKSGSNLICLASKYKQFGICEYLSRIGNAEPSRKDAYQISAVDYERILTKYASHETKEEYDVASDHTVIELRSLFMREAYMRLMTILRTYEEDWSVDNLRIKFRSHKSPRLYQFMSLFRGNYANFRERFSEFTRYYSVAEGLLRSGFNGTFDLIAELERVREKSYRVDIYKSRLHDPIKQFLSDLKKRSLYCLFRDRTDILVSDNFEIKAQSKKQIEALSKENRALRFRLNALLRKYLDVVEVAEDAGPKNEQYCDAELEFAGFEKGNHRLLESYQKVSSDLILEQKENDQLAAQVITLQAQLSLLQDHIKCIELSLDQQSDDGVRMTTFTRFEKRLSQSDLLNGVQGVVQGPFDRETSESSDESFESIELKQ